MADNALSGQELKRHIKIARDTPLPFAYNPGGPKEDDYFALHRKRSADQLGKAARKDGPGAKVAFGQARVDGKVLELRCEQVVASIARKLKMHLKANKVSLNVRVMDADGNILEEDIEDLPDDPTLSDDADDIGDTPDAAQTAPEAPVAPEPAAAPQGDATGEAPGGPGDQAQVVAALKRLQPAIQGATGPAGDKLKEAMAHVVRLVKSGDLAAAQDTLGKLETAVARLAEKAATAPEQAAPATDQPAPANDRLKTLTEKARALRPLIEADHIPAEARTKLDTAFRSAIAALKAGDLDQADAILGKVSDAAARLAPAPETAQPAPTPETPASTPEDRLKTLTDMARALRPLMDADQIPAEARSKLDTAFRSAVAALKGGDLDQAEGILDKVTQAMARLGVDTASVDRAKGPAPAAQATDDDADNDFDSRAHDLKDRIETLRHKMVARFGMEIQTALDARLDKAVADLEAGTYGSAEPAMAFVSEAIRLQDAIDALGPDFARAASTGAVEDVQQMRILYQSAVDRVAGPDHAAAWAHLDKVQDMIRDGAERNLDAFLADIPADARPFAMSRLNWTAAHARMKSEMDKLHAAIAKAAGDDEDGEQVLASLNGLYTHMEGLDLRLADRLDAIVNADPGPERDLRKAEAKALLDDYRAELGLPFFQDVDSANGFVPVAVASTAAVALGDIDRVLAG
ncbi:MAG: hypothetical protein CML68_10720 [Rhodobacteraceae bacterium]|nr:hypothetical protein [Paracoccaceae bacterium]